MVCTAEPSGVRRPPWEVPPSRRPIVQRPRADCEDDPVPGRTTRPERKALHNEPRLDDDALMHEPLLPASYAGFGLARATRDLHGPAPLGTGQDHLGSNHMLLCGIAITGDRLQAAAILRRDRDLDPCSHPNSMDRFAPNGNPPNTSHH